MTQRKIDETFFSLTPSSSRTNKRTRANETTTTSNRDEFDDLFETTSTSKRRRTNNKQPTGDLNDLIEIDAPSTAKKSVEPKATPPMTTNSSLRKKRSVTSFDDENPAIDELFGSGTRKRIRRQVKNGPTEEESSSAAAFDLFDIFKTRSNSTAAPPKSSDDFKTPITTKSTTGGKKIKMFFDDADLLPLRDELNEQNNSKDYVYIQPVVITGGRWLSKEAETKTKSKEDSSNDSSPKIPDDQRNLMHMEFVSLIVDDQIASGKKSKSSKSHAITRKSSGNLHPTILEGKSFQKQLVLSDSTIVRKENLQSCYNALLEDINKPRLPTSSKKSTKSSTNTGDVSSDDEQSKKNVDFFDLPTRKRKF